jgi:pSer/pThr/pTyr-binding forkhead associated (FHA) protein
MTALLFAKTGQLAGASYPIGEEATIGKSAGNTIQLYPGVISGKHARIYFDQKAKSYFIEDLKSRNGTRVDGVTVLGKEKLDRLHVITFAGQLDFIFQVVGEAVGSKVSKPAASPQQSAQQVPPKEPLPQRAPVEKSPLVGSKTVVDVSFDAMPTLGQPSEEKPAKAEPKTIVGDDFVPAPKVGAERAAPPQVPVQPEKKSPAGDMQKTIIGDEFIEPPKLGQPEKSPAPPSGQGSGKQEEVAGYYLEVLNLPSGTKSYRLKEGENLLGREADCDIVIADGSLSRKHAVLTVKEGKVYVKDLGSKNYTLLDKQRVNYETEIHAGAQLSFGMIQTVLKKR